MKLEKQQKETENFKAELETSRSRESIITARHDKQQKVNLQMMLELEKLKSVVGHLIQSVAEAKVSA